jgi:uncharacterized protein with GYD domain
MPCRMNGEGGPRHAAPSSQPVPHRSWPGLPPGAKPFPPEASTPHPCLISSARAFSAVHCNGLTSTHAAIDQPGILAGGDRCQRISFKALYRRGDTRAPQGGRDQTARHGGAVGHESGGTLDAFYYAYGGDDFFIIVDVPDSATATAASLTVNATGAVSFHTVVLITPEEVDAAVKKRVSYRPPGQ